MEKKCMNEKCWMNSKMHINGCIGKDLTWDNCNGEEPLTTKEAPSSSLSSAGLEGPAIDMDSVEHFICWLIDHCERDIISEEGLQRAYANFLTWHRKNKQKAD